MYIQTRGLNTGAIKLSCFRLLSIIVSFLYTHFWILIVWSTYIWSRFGIVVASDRSRRDIFVVVTLFVGVVIVLKLWYIHKYHIWWGGLLHKFCILVVWGIWFCGWNCWVANLINVFNYSNAESLYIRKTDLVNDMPADILVHDGHKQAKYW